MYYILSDFLSPSYCLRLFDSLNCPVVELLIKSSYLLPHHAIYILLNSCPQNIKLNLGPDSSLLDNVEWSILGYQRI